MNYTYERCNTQAEVSIKIAEYAARGLSPAGAAVHLNNVWSIAFVEGSSPTQRKKPFNITRGWPAENQLYTLGKVGIGMSQQEPKKRVVNDKTIERNLELKRQAREQFLHDYSDYLATVTK